MTGTELKRKKNLLKAAVPTVLFITLCSLTFMHASRKKTAEIAQLDTQIQVLQAEKETLQQEKEDLLLEIRSQDDPAWVEMTLKKELGLVPEGQVKVYFHEDND